MSAVGAYLWAPDKNRKHKETGMLELNLTFSKISSPKKSTTLACMYVSDTKLQEKNREYLTTGCHSDF